MTQIGIMQGRLVPPEPGRLQAFPRDRWADEFSLAKSVPLSYIEWIYDAYGEEVNPLGTEEGVDQLVEKQQTTGINVKSLCADWFMDYPFLRCSKEQLQERQKFLATLLDRAKKVGIKRIVLPFVDASAINSTEDENTVVQVLEAALPQSKKNGVELHLETSLGPEDFARLLDRVKHPMVKVNYDIGNSASLGYKADSEFDAYGDRIGSVHIKDRVLNGSTVPLGTGNADFARVFERLKEVDYGGDFTMQIARGEPGDEVNWARKNIDFFAKHITQNIKKGISR
jgi:L-ribulose-5-phosphate 3-epimerase